MEVSLWEACGRPTLDQPITSKTCPTWHLAKLRLQRALSRQGVHRRFPTWRSLWRAIRIGPAPATTTWGNLLRDGLLSTILNQSRAERPLTSTILTSWNPRWLLDHNTSQASDKRGAILDLLLKGHLVALQETHWHAAAAARWGNCFPGSKVAASPAILGPEGGWLGGVAVIVPTGIVLISEEMLVPAY
jgi:hypothetical protein